METLKIERTNEFINGFRNYGIYIDGKKVDIIANGKTKDYNLSIGKHTLYFKLDWCSSPEVTFDLLENETKRFKVGGFKHANWIMPFALLLSPLLYMPKVLGNNYKYLYFILIPVLVLIIYHLTLGRKKYLSLSEINKTDQ